MTNAMTVATRTLGRTKLFLIKHAPELMTYGGIVVTGVGIYLFCRASMHVNEALDIHDARMTELEDAKKDSRNDSKEIQRAINRERRDFTWEMTKLYGPAVTTTVCGFALILGGHHVISKRSAAISAAYKALEEGYSRYRRRVRDDLGEEADRKYLYGLKEEVKDVVVKDEEGNEKLEATKIFVADGKMPSQYARFFDEYSTQWTRSPEYNLTFLNAQQNYANDKLHAQGHLFLNEVYEMLGLPHTQAGSVVGWVLNKGGDNCVDFGIYDLRDKIKRAFVNGYEPSILLDFNVDGVIYDLI